MFVDASQGSATIEPDVCLLSVPTIARNIFFVVAPRHPWHPKEQRCAQSPVQSPSPAVPRIIVGPLQYDMTIRWRIFWLSTTYDEPCGSASGVGIQSITVHAD